MAGAAKGPLARFVADSRANMAIMMALALPLALIAAAFAIDEAALYHQKREVQAGVDLAAIHAASDPADAPARARRVLIDAGLIDEAEPLDRLIGSGRLEIVTGRYDPDPARPAGTRFAPGAAPPNAVRVAFEDTGRLYFARMFLDQPPAIGARALASARPQAGFSIGSRLASLNGGVANAVLGGLLGTELSLSVMDYQALADLDIELLGFLDTLSGQAGLSAGTYGAVLDSRVELADVAFALAAAASQDPGNRAAIDLLARIGGLIGEGVVLDMIDVVALDGLAGLALGTPVAGLAARVDALELLSVSALLADGDRQVALELGAGVPGLAGVSVHLVIGEPPRTAWYRVGGKGSYVRTAQTRLRLDLSVVGHGGTGIGLLDIGLPVYAELAPAEAELAELSCPPGDPRSGRATIAARPGILRLAVGRTPQSAFLDTASPLSVSRTTIVDLASLARVTALADIEMAQTAPQRVEFTHADAENATIRTVSTTTPVSSLTSTLLSSLDLRLEIVGLNLIGGLLNGLLGTVEGLVRPLAPALDAVLVTLFDVLGLGVGEADLRFLGFDCRNAVLEQ